MINLYSSFLNMSKSAFVFDHIYDNKKQMDAAAATDGVFIGRYVLVRYGEKMTDAKFRANWKIDLSLRDDQEIGQDEVPYYNGTVWCKQGKEYVLVADLNSIPPKMELKTIQPTYSGNTTTLIDESSNEYKYTFKVPAQWNFRVAAAVNGTNTYFNKISDINLITITTDDANDGVTSDYSVSKLNNLKSDENIQWMKKFGAGIRYATLDSAMIVPYINFNSSNSNSTLPGAIYYNKAGFSPNIETIDSTLNSDKIAFEPTGFSPYFYGKDKNGNPIKSRIEPDTYEFVLQLPSIGNSIAQMWNMVYGPGQGVAKRRETSIDTLQSGVVGQRSSNNLFTNSVDAKINLASLMNANMSLLGNAIVLNKDTANSSKGKRLDILYKDENNNNYYYYDDNWKYLGDLTSDISIDANYIVATSTLPNIVVGSIWPNNISVPSGVTVRQIKNVDQPGSNLDVSSEHTKYHLIGQNIPTSTISCLTEFKRLIGQDADYNFNRNTLHGAINYLNDIINHFDQTIGNTPKAILATNNYGKLVEAEFGDSFNVTINEDTGNPIIDFTGNIVIGNYTLYNGVNGTINPDHPSYIENINGLWTLDNNNEFITANSLGGNTSFREWFITLAYSILKLKQDINEKCVKYSDITQI